MTLHGIFPRILVLGPSGPFIAHPFGVQPQKSHPYIGFLICNEAEAEVWASTSDLLAPRTLPAVAGTPAQQPTSNPTRDRVLLVLPH